MNLISQKMGMSEWSYHNDYNQSGRQKMTHVDLTRRFESLTFEVELGFSAEQTAREVQRCLNCDVETVFSAPLCIECDACLDICPVQCLTITPNGDEDDLRSRLLAPATNLDQRPLRFRARCPRPVGSWSRTRTSACTADCAPSAVRRQPGTCSSSSFTIPYAGSSNFIPVAVGFGAGERS